MHPTPIYTAICLLTILSHTPYGVCGEPELKQAGPGTARRLLGAESVSARFRASSRTAAASIPDNVWRGVQQSGWRVQLAEFVLDAAPDLSGHQPRGWPVGSHWQNTDAVHLPQSRLLILAEKRRSRNGSVVDSSRVGGVLRHELGHAFDMAASGQFRFRSSAPPFSEAYHQDAKQLSAPQRDQLAYYLQGGPAGRQEAFAEAFGSLLGGGSDEPNRERFEQLFPRVLRYVQRAIAEYEPE